MAKIPQLKKKIGSFLTKEDGKISKESLIKTGVLLSAVAIASIKSAQAGCPPDTSRSSPGGHVNDHCNGVSVSYSNPTATGTHNHSHGSHGSHGSHASHASHGSHGSHGSHNSW